MATYLQGVTDYIPDYQPFQPDLNFYANLLQAKQNQYDTNYKAINNLYGQLYNADLTHDQNIKKKDELLKQIDFNLKRVAGLDLSLQQNVDQATQVFRPFYEDQYLMKDMAWTKNFNTTYSSALALENSADEKQRAKFWNTGIKAMQYKREEFKNATLDETLNIGNATYTPRADAFEKYKKLVEDLKISADVTIPDPSGLYFVRQKNGDLIMPTMQKIFASAYATDPALQKAYLTQAYVDRNDYVYQNMPTYGGDKAAAEKAYLQEKYDWLQNYTANRYKEDKEDLTVTENKIAAVEKDQRDGNVNFHQASYLEKLNQAFEVDKVVEAKSEEVNREINGGGNSSVYLPSGIKPGLDLTNMELARLKVDSGVASYYAEQGIISAADQLAYTNYVRDIKVNPVGLENLKHSHAVTRLNISHGQKKEQIILAEKLKRESDAIKSLVETGQYEYDTHVDSDGNVTVGKLKPNPIWNQIHKTPGSSGQAGPEIRIDETNREFIQQKENEMTNGYIDNWFARVKNLVDGGPTQIKENDLWLMMNWGDRDGRQTAGAGTSTQKIGVGKTLPKWMQESFNKGRSGDVEVYEAYGTKAGAGSGAGRRKFAGVIESEEAIQKEGDQYYKVTTKSRDNAIDQFNKLYNTWLENKDEGRKAIRSRFSAVMDGMDNWAAKNIGNSVAVDYWSDPELKNAKLWNALGDSYEKLERENLYKITSALGKVQMPYSGEIKDKLVDLYRRGAMDPDFSQEMFIRQAKQIIASAPAPQEIGSGGAGWVAKGLNSLNSQQRSELVARLEEAERKSPAKSWEQKDSEYNITPRKRGEIQRAYVAGVFGLDQSTGQRAVNEEVLENLFANMSDAYIKLATSPDKKIGLKSVVPITTSKGGKAALFADKSYYNVNPLMPQAAGTRAFIETVSDVMRINWNQDETKYRVSFDGTEKGDPKATSENVDYAKGLLNTMLQNIKPGSKATPFRIEQSKIALEDRNVSAMTIYPSMAFLENNVKSDDTGSTDKDAVAAFRKKIFENGISFIAPKNEWSNSLYKSNELTPTEQVINALGKIEYNDPNNGGNFVIEKVDMPNADYRISIMARSLQPDGSVREIGGIPKLVPKGNLIDDVHNELYYSILNATKINLETFREFHRSNNTEAMRRAEQNLGFTPSRIGFNY